MARRITIKDVARNARVSPQTVSRAINNKSEISPETRERILRIAERLGYRPNGIARSLATRRTRNVGLVVPDVSNPFFASIARGIEDAAHQASYNVFLCNTDENAEREISAIHSLEAQRVDGMLICSSRLSERELVEVADRFEPLVLVNRRIDRPQTGCVIVDDAMAMQEAVLYLLRLGHRQIGLLAGPSQSHSGRERVKGYQQAMQTHDITPPPRWQIHCPPQLQGGQIAARQLLQTAPELTALVAYNDLVAIGALRACAELGLDVPRDCAIVGCDDVLLAELVSPALTTIHISTYDLGRQAMGLLLNMIEPDVPPAAGRSQDPSVPIFVSPYLVLRDSVDKPRGGTVPQNAPILKSKESSMIKLLSLLDSRELAPALPERDAAPLAGELSRLANVAVYWRSITAVHNALFFLGRVSGEPHLGVKLLGILYAGENPVAKAFTGITSSVAIEGQALNLSLCPTTYSNAVALHAALDFTRPRTLGLETSAGCGDRLGLATPGHVRSVRKTDIAPIFTQQSIREMERTERTPEDVVNDATWGVFEEGWRGGYGADADHLKNRADVDVCVAAGFTFYTFDPREHVDNDAQTDDLETLRRKAAALPWDRLADSEAAMRERYFQTFAIEGAFSLTFDETTLLRAAAKYGLALAHVAELYRYLAAKMGDTPFEVEASVDETETTTSPEEHFFIASELKRLGVQWVSLAPRYCGRFEKGVDYIGDLDQFEAEIAQHAAIARYCGPYKLSIHSGSDKFTIYPIVARHTKRLAHLKTAGTSYLEALRAIGAIDPQLFRDILDFAFARYDVDKATYHVSADPSLALRSADLADDELATVLDNFHARQMLHVTFGSVLTTQDAAGNYVYRDRFFAALRSDEEAYYRVLETHFDKHLEPFT